jgi:hypothetical protein
MSRTAFFQQLFDSIADRGRELVLDPAGAGRLRD